MEYLVMCAVIFPFIRRIFSSIVLTCFLWTTLFQTIAFADFTRAGADSAHIESRDGFHYAHFSVGAQKMEGYPSLKDNAFSTYILPAKAPTLIIPIGKNLSYPELLFEKAFCVSEDISPTTVDNGLSWTFDGLDCYRENISGDLVVSKHDFSLHSHSTPIELSNHHGSTILDGDLPYEHLMVCGKDVIQRGKQVIESLLLRIQGTFVNTNFLSVGRLSFDSQIREASAPASPESSRATSPTPSLDSVDSTASSHSIGFSNEDTLTVREETTFGLLEPVSNTGKMTFERDVIFVDDILSNETKKSIFECHQKLQGTLRELFNEGNLNVKEGFDTLHIRQFINKGNIHGSGHLIVGGRDQVAVNTGVLHVEQLMLDLTGDFNNNGTIQADEILRTHGESTFHQSGTLSGKAIVINNAAFENEHEIDSSSLDLSFGDQVATFHNHEKIVLRTKSLTFSASTELKTSAINEGDLVTERFSNARETFINRDHITATSWNQHGKAFTNEFGGTIDVVRESLFDTDQIENAGDMKLATATGRIDQLINAGGFTVQRGGFKAKTIRNTKKMELLEGEYHIDHLENKGGDATIDQLSLMSESPTFEGKLAVNYFKPTSAEYKCIHIDGNVTLKSGDFKTKELVIKGSLSLGKGHYHIDVLKGDKGAKLLLQSGSRITIGDTEYDGDIVPEVNLELNPFQEKDTSYKAQLREDHSIRKTAFNAIPTATPVKKPILEETVFTKSKSIVDAQSDYKRINPDLKPCNLTELKSRLQSTIGTEITRIIHSPVKKDEIDFQKTLPVLPTTDRLYGHFEIFRHTSSAARDIVQKITTDGMDILDSLSFYVPSFESDFNFIKRYRYDLTRDMFMLWLREVFDEHDEGFTPYKFLKPRELPPVALPESIQQKVPFQTFTAPNSQPGSITDLLQNSAKREADFNGLSTRSATTHPLLQNSVLTASTNILGILGQVSSRQATDDEKKNVLQTVMGSQITRVIHEEKEQQAIDLETHLPTVEKSHWSYRHFEILRLTAKLSRTLVQQVAGHGYDALNYVTTLIPDFELDTDTLCTYSGIKRDMFMLWFKEILEQHEEGFTYSTRASLTFLSKTASKSGTIRTGKHVFLKASPASPPEWAATFLKKHKDTLRIDAKSGLTLEADTFLNTHELDLPYPFYLTGKLVNHGILRTKGIVHTGTSFQNGIDNGHMGTIECDGAFWVDIRLPFDNRFGTIEGTQNGWIKSQKEFLNGYFIESNEEKELSFSNLGRMWPFSLNGYKFYERHKNRNGAKIMTKGRLTLESLKTFNNDFGLIYGLYEDHKTQTEPKRKPAFRNQEGVVIRTPYTVSNKTGIIVSGGHIQIDAKRLESLIGDVHTNDYIYHEGVYMFPGVWRDWRQIYRTWYESDSARIATPNGNIYLNVSEGTSKGSYLLSPQGIYINGHKFQKEDTLPSYFAHEIVKTYNRFDEHVNKCTNDPLYNHHFHEVYHGAFRSGNVVDIQTDLFSMSGDANTPIFKLNSAYFDARGIYYHIDQRTGGVFFSVTDHARNKVLEGNPLYAQTEQGIHLSIKDDTHPHLYDPEFCTSLTQHSRANYFVSPAAFEHLGQDMFSDLLGRLHYKGLSGRPLNTYLMRNGTKRIQQLLASGIDPSDQVAVQNHFSSSVDGAIFCREREYEDGRVFNDTIMYLSPAMAKELVQGAVVQATQIDIQNEHHMTMTNGAKLVVEKQGEGLDPSLLDEECPAPEPLDTQFDVSTGSLFGEAAGYIAPKDTPITLTVKGDVVFIPKIKRRMTSNGYVEEIEMSEFKGGSILINSSGILDFTAVHMESEGSIYLRAKQLIDRHAMLQWESSSIEQKKDGSISIHSQGANAATSQYIARENIVLESDGTIDLFATRFKARLIHLIAEEDVRVHDVHNYSQTQTTQEIEGDGFFKKDTTRHTASSSSNSQGAVFDGKLLVESKTGTAVDFTNITATDGIVVIAPLAVVRFLMGVNTSDFQSSEQNANVLWQSMSVETRHDQTYSQSRIRGIINIVSQETIVQSVQGQTAEFLARIEQDGGKVTQQFLSEIHERMEDTKEGPTVAFAAIIAIAAAASTAGIGTAAGGALSGSLITAGTITANGLAATAISTVVSAGVASLASQAAVSLVYNKGDILKAADKLANSGTLKNMATDVAFAALLGTPTSGASIGTHVMHQVRSAFIRMGVEGAIHEKTDRKAWLKKAVINGFASFGASQVGALHRAAVIDSATHKIAHAFIGGMTGKLMYGNKAITPGIIGAFVSESVAELMMPTYGIDDLSAKDKPNYTQEQKLLVHAIAKSSAVLIAAICGFDTEAHIAFAVQTATTSLMFNHGSSVDKAIKKNGTAQREEEEEEKAPALTIGGTEFDVVDRVDNHPGRRKRSLSLTSLYLLDQKEQARADYKTAQNSHDREIALTGALKADIALANRPIVKTVNQATDYAVENPGKTSAYAGAALLSGGSVFAPTLGTGMFLGAAGGFVGSMTSHDFTINTSKDAASVAISTALGGLIPAPAKLFFPAAMATGVYGMNTNDPDLMWEGGLGAAFSFVPLVKEARHRFNTAKNVTAGSAHFTRSLDDLMVRPPANLNMPVRPTANRNVMSIPQPQALEATGTNGLQPLAQTLTGKPIAAADIDYRQIYMSSGNSTRTGGSGFGSNKSSTQTTLDSIAGKSKGESLTLDGGSRTIHESGNLTLSGSKDSGNLLVFRQNDQGRVVLSVGEKVFAEDLLQRPLSLKKTTARTLEKWDQVKATRATSYLLENNSGRYVPGIAHNSPPLTDAPKLLRGTQGNAGNIPADIAKMLEGKTFTSFDNFRNEFWKTVSTSKYASEFGASNLSRMQEGLAPFTKKSQHYWDKKVYQLHHKAPIQHGGSTYDMSNITITTPRYHAEVLQKSYHYGKKVK